jgi:hypothetical protein
MANDISLIMRIRSLFEGKGHQEAKREVEALGKKAKEAGNSGADGMNVMSAATAAMQGNLSGAATAISSLIGRVKLLGMSMMQLSLVAAVITSLIKLFQALAERADQMAANLRAIQSGNVTAAVERITQSYARMREETERAQKSRDKLFDVNMQELEAIKKLELAQINLNKQKELGAAATDKERAAIESKYKAAEMDRAKTFDDAASGFQRDLLGAKSGEASRQADRDRDQIDELMEQLRRRQQQTSYAQGIATQRQQFLGTNLDAVTLGLLRRGKGSDEEADKGRAEVAALIAKIEGLQKAVQDNTEAAQIYRKQADVAGIDIRTSGIQDTTARTALATDDRMRAERERAAAERERMQRDLDAMEARRAALASSRAETQSRLANRAASEQREADAYGAAAAGMRGRSGYGQANRAAAQEMREARAAAAAAEAYAAESTRLLKQIESALRAQRDALKRIPNS